MLLLFLYCLITPTKLVNAPQMRYLNYFYELFIKTVLLLRTGQVRLHNLLENIWVLCWKYLVLWCLQYTCYSNVYKSFIYHALKTPEYMINFDSILIILWIFKIIHPCQPFWVCLPCCLSFHSRSLEIIWVVIKNIEQT